MIHFDIGEQEHRGERQMMSIVFLSCLGGVDIDIG